MADEMFSSSKCTCDPVALSCAVQRPFTSYLEWSLKAMGKVMDKGLGTAKQETSFVHTMAVIQKLSKRVREKICKVQIVKLEKEFPRALIHSTK